MHSQSPAKLVTRRNEWMTWWFRRSHKGHRTFLVSIVGSSMTSQGGVTLSGKIISPQFLKGPLKKHPFAPLKRLSLSLHLCGDWGDPTFFTKDKGQEKLPLICIQAHPGEFPKQRERQLQTLLLKMKIASIPPFPAPPTLWHFLIKIEEEISFLFTHTPNVQMGK